MIKFFGTGVRVNPESRYSTAGMAQAEAERLTHQSGVAYCVMFSPRRFGDFQPFIIVEGYDA